MKPKVSICIPTYNGEKYLRECLDSVLSQTFTDFEVLVVDDQSRDESLGIAHSYATKDPRINILQNKQNLGLVANWNRCVELAQGEWIKFVFQDDLIAPECLEKMTCAAIPGDCIVVCRRDMLFDGVSEETRTVYDLFQNEISIDGYLPGRARITPDEICRALIDLKGENFIGEPTAVMMHQSLFERYGKFNPLFMQICDYELLARVAIHTGLVYIPQTLATFRVHPWGTSAVNREKGYRSDTLEMLLLHYEFAYHPAFGPLRIAAKKYQPPLNFKKVVARKALWSMNMAKRAAEDPVNPNSVLLSEWNSVSREFPKLTRSYDFLLLKFHAFLEKHFIWRFSRA